ncbi:MAG: cyclic nucleotide-binding domain-containing protein [Pseudomonadota bacterium]
MKSVSMSRIPRNEMIKVLTNIPFFKVLRQANRNEFNSVIEMGRLSLANPGEVVCRKGDFDSIMYFLLKGELRVFISDDLVNAKPLSRLFPGEIFGTLAFLNDSPRHATLQADPQGDGVLVMGIDFSPFGELTDFSEVGPEAKKLFYLAISKELERYLNHYALSFPHDPRTATLQSLQTPSLSTEDELELIYNRCCEFADLLCNWNVEASVRLKHLKPLERPNQGDIVKDIESFLFGQLA